MPIQDKRMSFANQPIMGSIEMEPHDVANYIKLLVRKNQTYMNGCINLEAAQNAVSSSSSRVLSSALAHKVAEGPIHAREHRGAKYVDDIETVFMSLAEKVFRAKNVEYRALSGSIADAIALRAITKPGDCIMVLSEKFGGHCTYRERGYAGFQRLKVYDIPFDTEEMNIDGKELIKKTKEVKPKVIVLGSSYFLFPAPIAAIRETAADIGAKIIYDGAQVMGLLAGRKFQDPLAEGADIITGSSQKTFPGCLGAFVLWNDDSLTEKISQLCFLLMATHSCGASAANAIVLAEMLEFGESYAEQVVKNAKSLAKALDQQGLDVLCKHKGFTESHQVLLDVREMGEETPWMNKAAALLEDANINCLGIGPWLRLGVAEVTRRGMKEADMVQIADFIWRILGKKENPKKVAIDVKEFRKRFPTIEYCFT